MRLRAAPRTLFVCILLGIAAPTLADEDLDAELDAAWGDRKTQAKLAEDPRGQFDARMKMLQAQRDAGMERCRAKSGGTRYCANYTEEIYRKARRALEEEFAGVVEEGAADARESRGFGRR
jgi:hypothetical protein